LVSGDPPVEEGAVHERETCALPGVAVRPVGAPGTVAASALLESMKKTAKTMRAKRPYCCFL
jgi:hypothetical protein